MKRKQILALCLAGALAFTAAGCSKTNYVMPGGSGENEESSEEGSTFDIYSDDTVKKTKEIEKYIDQYYLFDEDADVQDESYYDGIMEGLDDPYSVYYTPEEYKAQQESNSGTFEGIGATVSKNNDDGTVYIVKPLRDSNALKEGLKKDDIFIEVDGKEVTADMDLQTVVGMIRGEKGTIAHLKMYRPSTREYLEFDVERKEIVTESVEWEMLENGIGYLHVDQFIEPTDEQFKQGIDELTESGAKALILDFRDNPGGLVNVAAKMCDYVIDDSAVPEVTEDSDKGGGQKGMIVYTKNKDDEILKSYKCSDGHSVDLPIAILINGNSASASELFTGCIRDYKAATIVGTTSFGKGIAQSIIDLKDGSAIKLTVARYYTPSGYNVHEVGIDPDIEVEMDEGYYTIEDPSLADDNQLQKAIEVLGGEPLSGGTDTSGEDE